MSECYFCGSEKVYLPGVGIAFGIPGNDYSFCRECLTEMTADKFWEKMFTEHSYAYPPQLVSEGLTRGEWVKLHRVFFPGGDAFDE